MRLPENSHDSRASAVGRPDRRWLAGEAAGEVGVVVLRPPDVETVTGLR